MRAFAAGVFAIGLGLSVSPGSGPAFGMPLVGGLGATFQGTSEGDGSLLALVRHHHRHGWYRHWHGRHWARNRHYRDDSAEPGYETGYGSEAPSGSAAAIGAPPTAVRPAPSITAGGDGGGATTASKPAIQWVDPERRAR